MRDRQRGHVMRDIDRRFEVVKIDLWAVYKWADMANFPSKSGGGGGQKGEGDPVGTKATSGASGHYDDPSIKAAKDADSALFRILKNLKTLESAIATTKPPHVMSDQDREQCESCKIYRFERPSQWTLGLCKSCYDNEKKKARRRRR